MSYVPLCTRPTDTAILETDFCGDVDDVAALALLCRQAREVGFALGGVSVNVPGPQEGAAVAAVLREHGFPNVPVAVAAGPAPAVGGTRSDYVPALAARVAGAEPPALAPLDFYRDALPRAADGSVVIVSIGFFNNLAALLRAEPDLLRRKVRAVVAMAGGFGEKAGYEEFNVRGYEEDARFFVENWDGPLVFFGSECGEKAITDMTALTDHPGTLAEAFRLYTATWVDDFMKRSSWDPLTVDFAVFGGGALWTESAPGRAAVRPGGAIAFTPDPAGRATYLVRRVHHGVLGAHITEEVRRTVFFLSPKALPSA